MAPTRYQYDTDGPASDLPAIIGAFAGYVDGASNYEALAKGRPHAHGLPISIHGAKAKCYDMENGALTIPSGVQCAKRDIDAGDEWPWLYFSTSSYDTVKAECEYEGIWGKVILFGAHYGLTDAEAMALIESGQGYYAVQNVAQGYGATGHWDRSVLAPYIPGYDKAPTPPPKIPGTKLAPATVAALKAADSSDKTATTNLSKRHGAVAAEDGERALLEKRRTTAQALIKQIDRVLAIKP